MCRVVGGGTREESTPRVRQQIVSFKTESTLKGSNKQIFSLRIDLLEEFSFLGKSVKH